VPPPHVYTTLYLRTLLVFCHNPYSTSWLLTSVLHAYLETVLDTVLGAFWNLVVPAVVQMSRVQILGLVVDQVEVGHDHAAGSVIGIDLQGVVKFVTGAHRPF